MELAANIPGPSSAVNDVAGQLRVVHPPDTSLVVIIPALNEEATLADVLARIPEHIEGVDTIQVVVVNDGSSDQTEHIARAFGAIVVNHGTTGGVGMAIRSGLRKAVEVGADIVVHLDADGQFNPGDLPALTSEVLAGRADCALASRFGDPNLEPRMPWLKRWGNRQVSRIVHRITGVQIEDATCGMRCYNRDTYLRLSLVESFTYTHEALYHLAYHRCRLREIPIRVLGERLHGKSRVARSVLRYGCRTLAIAFRFLRDYHPFRLFGGIAFLLALASVACLGGLMIATGPVGWLAMGLSGLTAVGAVASLTCGVVGGMLTRQRAHLEEVLYLSRLMVAEQATASLRDAA